jgi:hypothetical protein
VLPDLEGNGELSFIIEPLQLASGAYVMEVRIQDMLGAANLAVEHSEWFQVSGPGATVVYEFGGIFVPRVRWDLPSSLQSADPARSSQRVSRRKE